MISAQRRVTILLVLSLVAVFATVYVAHAWTPIPVANDPLVRMPGTQPGQVSLEDPNRCLNCHEGYDQAVEPGFNWKGSMMAQAARDFLFWSCMTVAGQDSIWAVGTPNAVDICERCHFPKGWLEGRSDPPNASAMTGADYDGVQCDFCHRLYDPFFETTYNGTREGNDWLNYWDETNASGTPSQPAADATYSEDSTLAADITLFNDGPFFSGNLPPANYTENGAGQYFVSPDDQKRAPFSDANGRHAMLYSRYHKSKYFCSTCHDVSNPALANLGQNGSSPLTTETESAYSYFHVERTFSEFMLSDYAQPGGAPGIGSFAPGQFDTSHPSNYIATCQDCHLPDVVGEGADMKDAVTRPDDSVEHPNSGQPLHDMTGGNAWVSWVLASAVPGSPSYDSVNDQLLNQGSGVLTLDLTEGQGIDPVALLAGVGRAKGQLLVAAAIQNLSYDPSTGALSFQVQNQTGHKLISGFPEGRRMFVNIKAYAGGSLIHEVNPYDSAAGTLKGLTGYAYYDPDGVLPAPLPLGPDEVYVDELAYEMHPSSTLTGENETFHFALADGRYKDNRIPPKGFRIADAAARLSVPAWHGVEDPNYFTAAEYAGGYDQVSLDIAPGADHVEVNLYYQTTSREYIEFLRDEINGAASSLTGTGAGGDPPYLIQSDPFFSQLEAWGDTIWGLWTHNMNVDGAKPFTMTQASVSVLPPQPVVADFSGDPTSGVAPLAVDFTNLSEGNYNTCTWTFGDSGTSSVCNDPNHTYTTAGVYTVTLAVSGPGGTDTETKIDYITVYEPVVADFSASPTSGVASLVVDFTNQSEGDYDTCNWTFGDGGTSSVCIDPSHTYTAAGVYTVTLTISGPGGNDTETKTDYITVYEPVQADFSADPTSGSAPLLVDFTNLAEGDYDACTWIFGDGGTSSVCNDPSHSYATAGVYTITLTVEGLGGSDTLTRTDYITAYEAVQADFSGDPTDGVTPLTVDFTNLSEGDFDTCTWTFGDGGASSVCIDPSHSYTAAGVYTVTLSVEGLGGSDAETKIEYITVYDPVAADFSGDPTEGVVPLPVQFTNLSSGDFNLNLWSFGDGLTSTLTSPAHTYTAVGVYTVSLTISGLGGTDTLTRTNYITVTEQPPVPDFTASPLAGQVPLTVVFTDTSTGPVSAWLWDFGDGITSTLENPSHTYTVSDTFTVSLTVSGPGGSDTEVKVNYIQVSEEPIIANFIADPTSGPAPLTVQFTDESAGNVDTWLWSFGDGDTSALENPSHTYTASGVYTASLTASGLGGSDTLTRTNYITVYEPVAADFSADPTEGVTSLLVDFTNLSTGDYDTCNWTFGDGGTSASCVDPSHIYTAAGAYTITLSVSGLGGNDTLTRTNYITAYEAVQADFIGSPTVGVAPLTVNFSNLSTGDYDTCNWTFGDGDTSASCANPGHSYATAGVYTVTLAASGSGGSDTETKTAYITVYEPLVRLTTDAQSVVENVGVVTVTVELTATTGVTVTVPYTVGGTAMAADHDLADGSFEVAPGALTGSLTFTVTDDSLVEGDETVVVALGEPENAVLGTPAVQTITIEDNDVPPALVVISGPDEGLVQVEHIFTASVEPLTTTLPITYLWQTADRPPITASGGLSNVVTFTWSITGEKIISITATNGLGLPVSATQPISITDALAPEGYDVYLPVVLKQP
jgi:PKD repeat protein